MRNLTLGAILFLAAVRLASAKCPFIKYTVSGHLQLPSGVSPSTVRVYLFLDGSERTSDYSPQSGDGDYVVPNGGGDFEVTAWYDTWTGKESRRRGDDDCSRVATAGSLVLVADGLRARRIAVAFSPSKDEIKKKGEISARIPVIELTPLAPRR